MRASSSNSATCAAVRGPTGLPPDSAAAAAAPVGGGPSGEAAVVAGSRPPSLGRDRAGRELGRSWGGVSESPRGRRQAHSRVATVPADAQERQPPQAAVAGALAACAVVDMCWCSPPPRTAAPLPHLPGGSPATTLTHLARVLSGRRPPPPPRLLYVAAPPLPRHPGTQYLPYTVLVRVTSCPRFLSPFSLCSYPPGQVALQPWRVPAEQLLRRTARADDEAVQLVKEERVRAGQRSLGRDTNR